jgi:hypothetical protein
VKRYVSLNECTTIRDDVYERVDPRQQTNSARRRRSLHTRALRFVRDVCAEQLLLARWRLATRSSSSSAPPRIRDRAAGVSIDASDLRSVSDSTLPAPAHRVLLFALTVDVEDPEVARGAIERTMHELGDWYAAAGGPTRGKQGGRSATGCATERVVPMRRFWWAEFQKRGAIHYHGILVDPPFEFERDARRWFDTHWRSANGDPLAKIQTWVEYHSFDWFRRRGGDYILKDVRKLNGKQYEQDYTRMPKGWRTCSSHRLTFTAEEHQEHESKAFTVCTARPEAPWYERQRDVWVYRVDHHVPGRCGCPLLRPRRSLRGQGHNGRAGRSVSDQKRVTDVTRLLRGTDAHATRAGPLCGPGVLTQPVA